MNNLISVVIINKNDIGIVNTINGLNEQDYKGKFEVIVVDRSTIKYPKIASKIPLRWINFDAKGKRYTIPEQRNEGVKQSKGEIVMFIDANCIPNKNWLSEITKPIKEQGEKIVMGRTGSSKGTVINDYYNDKLNNQRYVERAPTINLAIANDVFGKVGMFDTTLEYGSDVDFSWRSIDCGYRIRYSPEAYITHDWGDYKEEFNRTLLYGRAKMRLLLKHFWGRPIKILRNESPAIFYPILLILLPISIVFPQYLLLFLLVILKNIKQKNPLKILVSNIVFSFGELDELRIRIMIWLKNQ